MSNQWSDLVGLVGRTGLLDPTRWAATAGGLARWGPSIAALYRANALRHPARAAVIDHRGSLSFARLERRSTASARGLRSLDMADRTDLGLLCRNHRDAVEMNVAAAKAGRSVVHLNPGFAPAQLAEVLSRERVGAVVVDAGLADLVVDAGFDGPVVIADGSVPASAHREQDAISMPELRRSGGRLGIVPPAGPNPPVLLTSGTTGTPKGARRSASAVDVRASAGVLTRIPFRNDDRFLIAAPLFHAWGLSQLLVAASLGATVVLRPDFEPAETVRAAVEHEATVLVAVPVMLQRMLQADPGRMASLRIVASSGSALPAGLATRWMDAVGDGLYNLYGSTEVGQATIATPEDLRADPATAGRVVPGTRVELFDDDGEPVPGGEVGRIFVGSGAGFDGYTGGGSKESIGGLLATGDLGRFDEDGLLFVTGRADDMIVSGGENVFPQEVEEALAAHPSVVEVAVVGVHDEAFGQRLAAYVVAADPPPTADDLRTLVAARLARHKVPRDVVFVDRLPRTESGKVLRRRLGSE